MTFAVQVDDVTILLVFSVFLPFNLTFTLHHLASLLLTDYM